MVIHIACCVCVRGPGRNRTDYRWLAKPSRSLSTCEPSGYFCCAPDCILPVGRHSPVPSWRRGVSALRLLLGIYFCFDVLQQGIQYTSTYVVVKRRTSQTRTDDSLVPGEVGWPLPYSPLCVLRGLYRLALAYNHTRREPVFQVCCSSIAYWQHPVFMLPDERNLSCVSSCDGFCSCSSSKPAPPVWVSYRGC